MSESLHSPTQYMPAAGAIPLKLGLRERSKLDKRRRIRLAAREMFLEKGYDAATTREIAERADVAIGTLFVYAKDKRDLLMMIINDDLDQLTALPAALAEDSSLIDQLMDFFHRRYQYWRSEPRLSRPAIQETFDFIPRSDTQGPETARFYARRVHLADMLSAIIQAKQTSGRVSSEHSAQEVASLILIIYMMEVRRWVNEDEVPDLETGLARLRKLVSLALSGIQPADGEMGG
ncbi:TetR/AcrR family transcriptional regulator [Undibacterium sp.]|uniref:TetR/AcrR family transcriptional regulator n=1 Tax=Undibacterium sp. TaxID=1914977 RepID=UPI00374DF549